MDSADTPPANEPARGCADEPAANPNRLETEEDRQRVLEKLRAQHGDQWLKENRARLDREWEWLKDL